jgi:hypothetical protein
MKKFMVPLMCLVLLAGSVVPALACRRNRTRTARNYYSRNYNQPTRSYYDSRYYPRQRTFWDRHRDKLTVGIGTGAGALIGGVAGGGKGAGIGALLGAGGSALYTYKLRDRRRRY